MTQFVSIPLKVNIVTALFVCAAQPLIVIVHVGNTVSNIVLIVLDTVFGLFAASVATHADTDDVLVHCALGVTVHLYTVPLTAVNKLITQLLTLTSHHVKFVVVSLNVHVTIYVAHVTYVHALLVNVTVGATVSYMIVSLIIAVLRFHGVSLYCTYTYFVH